MTSATKSSRDGTVKVYFLCVIEAKLLYIQIGVFTSRMLSVIPMETAKKMAVSFRCKKISALQKKTLMSETRREKLEGI